MHGEKAILLKLLSRTSDVDLRALLAKAKAEHSKQRGQTREKQGRRVVVALGGNALAKPGQRLSCRSTVYRCVRPQGHR